MANLKNLIKFLDDLDNKNIYYKLNHIRNSILVEVAIPGERWEVEFLDDGSIEIEKFISEGKIYGAEELENLLKNNSD